MSDDLGRKGACQSASRKRNSTEENEQPFGNNIHFTNQADFQMDQNVKTNELNMKLPHEMVLNFFYITHNFLSMTQNPEAIKN